MRFTFIHLISWGLLFSLPSHAGETRHCISKESVADYNKMIHPGYVPLLFTKGNIVVYDVPTMFNCIFDLARSLSSPVYVQSTEPSERKRDVNVISMSGISLEFRSLGELSEDYELLIDVSKAKVPPDVQVELLDIVQYAIMCIRMEITPGVLNSVKIKIIGAQIDPKLMRLEGELWATKIRPIYKKQG